MRLFNLGFPKSGTTTVNRALTEAGLRSVHWEAPAPGPGPIGPAIYKRYFEGVDPLKDFAGIDAITQADYLTGPLSYWPQMDFALVRQIARHHPDCKLLLLRRDPRKIADSISKWGDFIYRLNHAGAPGMPAGHATSDRNMVTWITGHYHLCRALFGGYGNYLEIDIDSADAPKLLSTALGIELPWWGKENAGENTVWLPHPSPKRL